MSHPESLPHVVVETEREDEGGLRHRHLNLRSSISPPLRTSTPVLQTQHWKHRAGSPPADSGYSASTASSSTSREASSSSSSWLGSPVQQLARRWKGRQSFLEPSSTKIKGFPGKIVNKLEPQQILAALVVFVVILGLSFTLFISIGDSSIQSATSKIGEVEDDNMIPQLGGKKAAIQFSFDRQEEMESNNEALNAIKDESVIILNEQDLPTTKAAVSSEPEYVVTKKKTYLMEHREKQRALLKEKLKKFKKKPINDHKFQVDKVKAESKTEIDLDTSNQEGIDITNNEDNLNNIKELVTVDKTDDAKPKPNIFKLKRKTKFKNPLLPKGSKISKALKKPSTDALEK